MYIILFPYLWVGIHLGLRRLGSCHQISHFLHMSDGELATQLTTQATSPTASVNYERGSEEEILIKSLADSADYGGGSSSGYQEMDRKICGEEG